ncbi:hypothetical protein TNCV_1786301 [Trichonephila clavipes]|nr:hypothetical protein TNCV_1786301 [Trichonephila clavipes]
MSSSLVPLKIHRVGGAMHVNLSRLKHPLVGVVWKLGEGGASSGVVFVTQPWFKMTSLVVKVTDSWPACHEFESSTAEDLPYMGAVHVKSVEAQTSSRWCGVEVTRG